MQQESLRISLAIMGAVAAATARADEGGVSFWLPGQLSSFAAAPGAPGFSMPLVYYHTTADSDASKTFITGGNLVAGIHARANLLFYAPTYTFATPLAGGQAAISVVSAVGTMSVHADVTLDRPNGVAISGSTSDSVRGGGDLYPMLTLKWNEGASNWMVYGLIGVPLGAYKVGRLANLGLNHWSVDAGGAYTYFDTKEGHEFSITGGVTCNFENSDTDYKNGVDSHIDWAASQFLNEQLHVGLVGYIYQQLTGDGGSGAKLGDYKGRVYSAGPQLGYFLPMGKEKGYFNVRGYYEWGAENRAEGWNVWLTLSVPM